MGANDPTKRTNQPGGIRAEPSASPDASPPFSLPYLWPLLAAASASQAGVSFFADLANTLAGRGPGEADTPEPAWATPNTVALELPSMRLRDFSTRTQGQPTLVCAPYALHASNIADFAPGHSVIEAMRNAGLPRVFATDWRSATPDMSEFSIDTYLADLNVAIDDIGPPVDLVGLCQGGWLGLVYAARFPGKIGRLALAGAPVDFRAGDSYLSRIAADVPLATFENLIRLGEGRVLGQRVLDFWAPALDAKEADRILQLTPDMDADRARELKARFREWYVTTVDLPGRYFLQVVRRLFKENQIAEGRFVALGRSIDLASVRAPVFLLAARDDELVSPEQAIAAASLIGTPKSEIHIETAPCNHLSLFLGARTIDKSWRKIANWLNRDARLAKAS